MTKISATLGSGLIRLFIVLIVTSTSSCGNLVSNPKQGQTTSGSKVPYQLISTALFPSPISTALSYLVGKNSFPILAPSKIPTKLSAKTSYTQTSYKVSLYQYQSILPLNSPKIGSPPWCSGLAHHFGNFSGTQYSTSVSAGHWLRVLNRHRTQFCGAIATRSIKVGVSRGIHIVLSGTEGTTRYCEMTFYLNGWSVVIGGGATLSSLSAAKHEALRIIEFMREVQMPQNHGEVIIQTVGDGDHAFVDWTYNSNLYSISSYHSANEAFSMAGSIAETLPVS